MAFIGVCRCSFSYWLHTIKTGLEYSKHWVGTELFGVNIDFRFFYDSHRDCIPDALIPVFLYNKHRYCAPGAQLVFRPARERLCYGAGVDGLMWNDYYLGKHFLFG